MENELLWGEAEGGRWLEVGGILEVRSPFGRDGAGLSRREHERLETIRLMVRLLVHLFWDLTF